MITDRVKNINGTSYVIKRLRRDDLVNDLVNRHKLFERFLLALDLRDYYCPLLVLGKNYGTKLIPEFKTYSELKRNDKAKLEDVININKLLLIKFSILAELLLDDDRKSDNWGFSLESSEVVFIDFEHSFARNIRGESTINRRMFGDILQGGSQGNRYATGVLQAVKKDFSFKIDKAEWGEILFQVTSRLEPIIINEIMSERQVIDWDKFNASRGRVRQAIDSMEEIRILKSLENLGARYSYQ